MKGQGIKEITPAWNDLPSGTVKTLDVTHNREKRGQLLRESQPDKIDRKMM